MGIMCSVSSPHIIVRPTVSYVYYLLHPAHTGVRFYEARPFVPVPLPASYVTPVS